MSRSTVPAAKPTITCLDDGRSWAAVVTDRFAEHKVELLRTMGPVAGDWTLMTTEPATGEVDQALIAPGSAPTAIDITRAPRVRTPDGRCIMYLMPLGAPATERRPSAERGVLIVGDSLAAGLVRTDDLVRRLRERSMTLSVTTTIDGLSGATWLAAGDGEVPFADEFRGIASLPRRSSW